ncbi:unnamed protein product [Mytilus coruscus]|uniref:Uncharacterized protein n=1 Tax=Mytilus coruscus TaxID=42192 RepID=A0A6J8C4R2_MYTCO|nr:unnamed protein product [Mytilus coruscus]
MNNIKKAEEMLTTIDMSFFFQNADILKSLGDETLAQSKGRGDHSHNSINHKHRTIRGIAVTHNNDLLISDAISRLKLVHGKTGKISDSKDNVEPLAVTSVHITCDNKVIVGAMIPGKAFPVIERRVVIVMDQEGNHLTVYEQDKHKHNMFSYPRSITSTNNGNIFVGDRISGDKRGRVLVLGKDGDILNENTGCHDIYHKYKYLRIANITTTPSDNIVVFDLYHHLHILDSSANPKYYYDIRDIGIKYSYCLVFTCPTTFYLGCSPPTNSTTNSKVYEVQCSGF